MKTGKRAVIVAMALLLGGCGISEERKEARQAAIGMVDNGQYEAAIGELDGIIGQASRVTDFELDVLKYRAEAEFLAEDYEAAAYTYGQLLQVDEPKAEYYYFSALALSKSGDMKTAMERLKAGEALDPAHEMPGHGKAVTGLAEAYEAAGDLAAAEALYKDQIAQGENAAKAYHQLAALSMKSEEYEKALEYVKEGLSSPETAPEVRKQLLFNEAVCNEYLGRYPEALALFEAYVAEFGQDEKAAHEIAFLKTR